jgi:hypothetical protein
MKEKEDKTDEIKDDNTINQDGDINLADNEQNGDNEAKNETNVKLAKQMKKQVLEVFKGNPDVKSVFVTSDGNVFLDKNKSYAVNHCKRDGAVKREKPLEMVEVLRSEI